MKCEAARSEMVSYLRGELSLAEREAVAEHLGGCLACRKEEAALREFLETARDLTELEPSPDFHERVMAAVRARARRGADTSRLSRPRNLFVAFVGQRMRKAPIVMTAIAVHAAAILLLAGIYIPVRLSSSPSFRVTPTGSEGAVPPETLDGIVETSLPREFGALRNPLEDAPGPSTALPGREHEEVFRPPLPPQGNGPRVRPEDFNHPLKTGPRRTDVLGWFGGRLDPEMKTKRTEAAGGKRAGALLERGLRWLASRQEPDGSFDPVPFRGKKQFRVGVTGLAMLAFLGDGHTPNRGIHARTASRCMEYLLEVQDGASGRFGPAEGNYHYNHGIALLAMTETCGMLLADRDIRPVALTTLVKSIRLGQSYLLDTQRPEGGWGYTPGDSSSDTSVTAWPVAALASSLRMNISPPGRGEETKRALSKAAKWFRGVTMTTGEVGYRGRGRYKTGPCSMTALSLYCRGLFLEEIGPGSPEVVARQVEIVSTRMPEAGRLPDYYFWYYGAFALRHTPRAPFRDFYSRLVDVLAGLQKEDGSFSAASLYGEYGGTIYTTAMALMALEAPFRYPAD